MHNVILAFVHCLVEGDLQEVGERSVDCGSVGLGSGLWQFVACMLPQPASMLYHCTLICLPLKPSVAL